MNRRAFIAGLGGAAAWPLVARAQQFDRTRTIGVLFGIAENDPIWRAERNIFVAEMQRLGWDEGRNLRIEYRTALGNDDLFHTYATELISLKPDVILSVNPSAIAALAPKTKSIPIVFTVELDPVREGHVASTAHPGGNITGFTDVDFTIASKWPQLLKEIAPNLRAAIVLFHPQLSLDDIWMRSIESGSSAAALDLHLTPIREAADIEPAITNVSSEANGLLVSPSPFTAVHRAPIIAAANKRGLPAVYPLKYFTVSGGLMSYSPDQLDEFRRAAGYVDRILRGANPGELPVQEPTKFELVVNLKTAKALGLIIPPTLLARADEVIE
jgi:putative tryptophan/tyrosine transport system substrate-binding protein